MVVSHIWTAGVNPPPVNTSSSLVSGYDKDPQTQDSRVSTEAFKKVITWTMFVIYELVSDVLRPMSCRNFPFFKIYYAQNRQYRETYECLGKGAGLRERGGGVDPFH